MKPQSLRFNEIDLLRGIACLSVLVFHYLSRGPRAGWMPSVELSLAESLGRYGYLGVHLFFLISGFVILMSAQQATPRSFFASRAARLYPALWAGATLTAFTAWIYNDARFSVSFQDYLINLTMLAHWFNTPYVDGAYWSLAYELHFYIFVWLALRFNLMRHLQWLLAGWLLISAINAIRPMWPVEFWLNAKWAPFFTAGGIFYLIRTRGITPSRIALLVVSFTLALVYALGDGHEQNQAAGHKLIQLPIIVAAVTVMFITFWLIAIRRLQMQGSWLTFYAGALTYPVYVVHQNFGYMIFGHIHETWGNGFLAMALVLIAVFGLSWFIHAFIEQSLSPRLRRMLDNRYARKSITPAVEG